MQSLGHSSLVRFVSQLSVDLDELRVNFFLEASMVTLWWGSSSNLTKALQLMESVFHSLL